MFLQEISIEIKSKAKREEIEDSFDILMNSYHKSGQTLGRIESHYIESKRLVSFPFTHEKNSLSTKFNNQYVNRRTKTIEDLCKSKVLKRTLGKTYTGTYGICKCKKPGFYILSHIYPSIASPIKCGNCDKAVPLYRLPIYHDHGYGPILGWETNYHACYDLWFNGNMERWAQNQLQNFDSVLSTEGMGICKRVEELTGTPTYYGLFNYRNTKAEEKNKLCPSCNGKWELKESLHDTYDYKCKKCRLISEKSKNI